MTRVLRLDFCVFVTGLNNFVEWPAIHNRLFTWLSAYRNASGLLYYETNRWFGGNEKAHAAEMAAKKAPSTRPTPDACVPHRSMPPTWMLTLRPG